MKVHKTLVVYVFHEYNENVKYFLKNGIFKSEYVDFWIVINNPYLTIPINVPNYVTVVNRENKGHDFGGYSYALYHNRNKYRRYIVLNSTVSGPFIPNYLVDRDWTKIFTRMINKDTKLSGTTLGIWEGKVHIQSMLLCFDNVGLNIGINAGVFELFPKHKSKHDIVMEKEVGFSQHILQNNYNIRCLLEPFNNIDFRLQKYTNITKFACFAKGEYFGGTVHPYDVVFIKSHASQMQTIKHYMNIDKLVYKHRGIKYIKVDLNPFSSSGLCNQLISLCNACIIGHYTGRIVYCNTFYPDYNSKDTLPLDTIINIQKYNTLLASLCIYTYVVTSLPANTEWIKSSMYNGYKNKSLVSNYITMNELCNNVREYDDVFSDIGDTFTSPNEIYANHMAYDRVMYMLANTPFNDKYIDDKCYDIGIHMRLEDDIYKSGISQDCNVYTKYIDNAKQTFIATGLCKYPNKYNYVLEDIKRTYNINMNNSTGLGREIDAIYDFVSLRKCSKFVGCKSSTLSQIISYYVKDSILL